MNPERTETTTRPGHPTIGLLAVAPIPAAEQAGETTFRHSGGMPVVEMYPTIIAGVVTEIGPTPEQAHEQLVPYQLGATVWYAAGAEIRVGGTHYLPMTKVISWLPSEEAADGH